LTAFSTVSANSGFNGIRK
jgi:hypothetical protein